MSLGVSVTSVLALATLFSMTACANPDPLLTGSAEEPASDGPLLAKPPGDSVRLGVTVAMGDSYRIQGDGLGEYLDGFQGIRAVIDAPGNLQITPVNGYSDTPPQRTLVFDFTVPVDPANSYSPDISGQWNWKIKTGNAGLPRIQDLGVNASRCYPSTIAQDNKRIHHRDVFNPPSDGQATYLYITRTSSNTWSVVSDGPCSPYPDVAALWSQDLVAKRAPLVFRGYFNQRISILLRGL